MNEIEIHKAAQAIDYLLMAYSSMIDYRFDGAKDMRAAVMAVIHALEEEITSESEEEEITVETRHDEEHYMKEIVEEDGQFCVRSKDGSRNFGCYISRERAEERLRQVESFAEKMRSLSAPELAQAYKATRDAIHSTSMYFANHLVAEELLARERHPAGSELEEVEDIPLATIVKEEQRFTMGPVYVPGLEDAHGETIEALDLQKSIWDWVRKEDRRIFLQHSEKVAGEMVEILTMPFPIETSLIVPTQGVTKYSFPENTPFMGVIWEEWAWELVKSGKLRGYSIGGQAQRVEVELAESPSL